MSGTYIHNHSVHMHGNLMLNVIIFSLLKQPSQSCSLLECMSLVFHQQTHKHFSIIIIENLSKLILSQCDKKGFQVYDASVWFKQRGTVLTIKARIFIQTTYTPQYNSFPNNYTACLYKVQNLSTHLYSGTRLPNLAIYIHCTRDTNVAIRSRYNDTIVKIMTLDSYSSTFIYYNISNSPEC